MKRIVLVVLAAASMALPEAAWAQTTPGSSGRPGFGSRSGSLLGNRTKRRKATLSQQVLRKRVELVEWEEATLEEVVDWLDEQGDASVVVHWRALEDVGVDRDSEVSLRLKNTTVGTALTEALEQVSEVEPVMFRGIGSIIKITTKSDFNRKLYVRVYAIDDLVFSVPDFFDAPVVSMTEQGSGGGGGGGGGGDTPPIFGDDDSGGDEDEGQALQDRIDDLILLIQDTIEPDSWFENGGQGTIRVFNKMLVVRNSIEVHEKLGGPFEFE